MKPRLIALLAALTTLALAVAVARPKAPDLEAASSGRPELVAATFSSAWCASCRVLAPRLAKVIPGFSNAPVAFVDLDFTFGDRREIAEKAARYGIAELYERNKGATGFTVLVDAQSGAILDTLTMNFSEDAMREAIAAALAIASSTDENPPVKSPEKV